MRGFGLAIALGAIGLAGCTSVKLVQRDGCWVRRTERAGNVKEELGPCVRPAPPWSDDRATRLVQECVTAAEHRRLSNALAAWGRGAAPPAEDAGDDAARACAPGGGQVVLAGENEALRARTDELKGERDALRSRTEADGERFARSAERLGDWLGEAARKAQQPATATATATSEGRLRGDLATRAGAPPPARAAASPAATVACASPGSSPGSSPGTAPAACGQAPAPVTPGGTPRTSTASAAPDPR